MSTLTPIAPPEQSTTGPLNRAVSAGTASVQPPAQQITLSELLRRLSELGGSDLHVTTNSPPQVRVHGHLQPLEGYRPLASADTKQLAYSVLTDAQKHRFEENLELDLSFGVKGLSRFRANIFNQRGAVGAVFRAIPYEIRSFHDLGLPPVVEKLCEKPRGLILVTGPTGSGKSTTLAAMLDKINCERREHILTIEDPIEFLHNHKSCLVNQREVHADTHGFTEALRTALRQDPDVVLIGEMRDLETIESALRIAETGHLTFATLHTNSAASTINRIIDVFPSAQQAQIRAQLSLVLEGILCQALLPKADGRGRAMAMEIMVPNSAIRNLIREDKVHQIYSMMQTGQDKYGMQTFNQSLATLYHKRQVSLEIAMQRSSNTDELKELIERGVGIVASNAVQPRGPVPPGARPPGPPPSPNSHPSPYATPRPIGTRPVIK
jgi:twitching motility protein PilT